MRLRWSGLLCVVSILVLVSMVLAACGEAATPTPTKAPEATKAAGAASPVATGAVATATVAKPAASPTTAVKTGGTLIVGSSADSVANNLDANLAGARTTSYWLGPIYESLLGHDLNTFAIVPKLAEKWDVASDGKSITLYIRKGVKWHNLAPVNGREFTADDVKWNLERVRDSKERSQWKTAMQIVSDVQVVDKYTAKIVLKEVYAGPFLSNLADNSFMMYPKELYDQYGDKQNKTCIGTGPFMFKSYEPDSSFRMVKNPDYWDKGYPRLDGIDILVIKDAAARMAALRSGQIHYLDSVAKTDVDSLKKTNPDLQVFAHTGFGYGIRLQLKNTAFKDVKVRKALNLAIDRQALIQLVLEGDGKLLGMNRPEVNPAAVYRTPEELAKIAGYKQPKDADIAEAKKLLAEAGYANGLTIKASVFKDDARILRANEVIKEQLKAVGITWNLELYDYATIGDQLVTNGNFEAAMFYETGGDADKHLSDYKSDQQKAMLLGVGDPELDKLLVAGRAESDEAKRAAIYRQVEDKMQNELFYRVFLIETNNYMVVNGNVRELKPMFGAPFQFFEQAWKYAWINK